MSSIGLAGPIGGYVGAVLGLTGLGLSELATRWRSETSWVNICVKDNGKNA